MPRCKSCHKVFAAVTVDEWRTSVCPSCASGGVVSTEKHTGLGGGLGVKLLKTLHSKAVGDRRLALCLYETEDGRHVYGVEENDVLVFTGTKAEAKERYGRGW